jgi:type IV secretory pathway VirB2 component (pilin)
MNKVILLACLLLLTAAPAVHAAGTGGRGSLPWDTPLQTLQQDLTGPVAKGVSLVAIVGAGFVLMFLHAEMNSLMKIFVWLVLIVGLVMGANAFMTTAGASGAETSYGYGKPKHTDTSRC